MWAKQRALLELLARASRLQQAKGLSILGRRPETRAFLSSIATARLSNSASRTDGIARHDGIRTGAFVSDNHTGCFSASLLSTAAFHTTAQVDSPRDYYEVLGVPRTATEKQLKEAYYKRAMKLHPDRNKEDPNAQAKFQELHNAYTTLSNPEKRHIYDQVGPENFERMDSGGGAGAWDQGGAGMPNVEDIFKHFSDMFGSFDGGFFDRGFGRMGGMRSLIILNVTVSFMEAVHGVRKNVKMPNGRKIEVNIPAGVENGTALQVEGAILTVEVRPHRIFQREGLDIFCQATVDVVDAILGGRVTVPSLNGDIEVVLEGGTQHGDRLRLAGRGVQAANGVRGNQIVVVRIAIPRKVTPRQRELLLEFAEEEQAKKAA